MYSLLYLFLHEEHVHLLAKGLGHFLQQLLDLERPLERDDPGKQKNVCGVRGWRQQPLFCLPTRAQITENPKTAADLRRHLLTVHGFVSISRDFTIESKLDLSSCVIF